VVTSYKQTGIIYNIKRVLIQLQYANLYLDRTRLSQLKLSSLSSRVPFYFQSTLIISGNLLCMLHKASKSSHLRLRVCHYRVPLNIFACAWLVWTRHVTKCVPARTGEYPTDNPRFSKVKENCELWGTDNVQGQISDDVFSPSGGYRLLRKKLTN